MMRSSAPLSPERREASLAALTRRTSDVLVVGGGVVGAGAALDAATRGLRTGLVEARDWASGTSSRSSKLVHGGLRYLEQLDLGLVREALRERHLILTSLAPHLARPVPFLYPLRHRVWERAYVGSGLLLYDTMGGVRPDVPRHRHLGRRAALREFPGLRDDALVGAIRYFDGQLDDARHTVTLARTAAAYGAHVASSARVTGLLREGDRVVGVVVEDVETGVVHEVRARRVINAAGVWSNELQDLLGVPSGVSVRASKGVHLVVPRDRIDGRVGLISRTQSSVLFVIPWGDTWLIGTTDTDWNLDLAHPAATSRDIAYLLEQANRLLRRPLTRSDVLGVYAGLRPLLAGESEATSRLSREHAVVSPAPGLVTVAGGKYTTYRVMARDAVDLAVRDLPETVPESCTHEVPLLGAEGYAVLRRQVRRTAEESGLTVSWVEHLLERYGSLTSELLEMVAERPSLAAPLTGAPGYLAVEAVYAATSEGALHLDDVLTRRTRISITTADRGTGAAEEVAALVGPVLGWSTNRAEREVEGYRERVRAEVDSQTREDDNAANVARMAAVELRAPDVPAGSRRPPTGGQPAPA